MADHPTTLGGLLESGRFHYQAYDIGRGVTPIEHDHFARFEAGEAPYPYPLQRHAWLGLLGWDPDAPDDHFIWFLKFPLDELALLNQAARDDFLARLIEGFEQRHASGTVGEAMNESPYGIRPREETMAQFHALALKRLGLPPSRFYDHARAYLSGHDGFEQWAFVGLQGIADIAARLDEGDNAVRVAAAIPLLPPQPFTALCIALEGNYPNDAITAALAARLRDTVGKGDGEAAQLAAGVRGLATATDGALRHEVVGELLDSAWCGEIELLAAIAGRCWRELEDPALCLRFLEALAANSAGGDAFHAIVADLLFIPGMREPLMVALRNPRRSAALASAVGLLFG